MSTKHVVILTSNETTLSVRQEVNPVAGNFKESFRRLLNWLEATDGGNKASVDTVEYRFGEVAATAVMTFTDVVTASDTFVLNGVTFTAVASGATGNQWNIGADEDADAAACAAAINASATAAVASVTASTVAGVLTLTCDTPGIVGNGFTLSESLDNCTITQAWSLGATTETTSVTR